jgi:hypothetical protein
VGTPLHGATYSLSSGEAITGEPFHFDANGVVFRYPDGRTSPRFAWTNFTEASLKDFAQNPKAQRFVSNFIESPEDEVRVKKEITVKTPPRLDRPIARSAVGALFASPLSIALLVLVYFANLYAAYEIAVYRRYPRAMVIAAAAVLPFAAPAVFLCLPTRTEESEPEPEAAPTPEPAPQRSIPSAPPPRPAAAAYSPPARFSTSAQSQPAPGTAPTEAPAEEVQEPPPQPAAPRLPEPVVYRRGQTMFNRRFFETKMAGFLRMVPSESEKDLVINIKSSRGEYVGHRISKLQPDDLTLQFHRGSASSDVTIPFTEIQEVTIKHKDA